MRMMSASAKIAKVIRAHYHSWEEFAQAYIEGVGFEGGIADKQPEFTELYKKLCTMPDGPYSVAWETPI